MKVTFEDGSTIETTKHHPFLTQTGEFEAMGNLKAGDAVMKFTDQWQTVKIKEIENIMTESEITVYNFEVETYHVYFAADFAVHNSKEVVLY